MKDNYEISENTLAVVGLKNGKTRIIEYNLDRLYDLNSYSIMDYGCNYFGSSYNGRAEGTKKIMGYSYKVPIIVEETSDLIFFPTTSPTFNNCIWFNLAGVLDIQEKFNVCIVTLINKKRIVVQASKSSLENQILRATRLKYLINGRKKVKN